MVIIAISSKTNLVLYDYFFTILYVEIKSFKNT